MESVRVAPGMSPPSMSTTPNSPTVCRKLSTDRGQKRAPGQRNENAQDEPHGTGAEQSRGIDQGRIDRGEAGDERLHRKRQAVDDRSNDQTIEGKGKRVTKQGRNAAAKGGARAEQDEKKEAEHGGRQNHGQRGQSLKSRQPSAAAQHQQGSERHGYGQQNDRGDRRQTKRERECLPVHEFHSQTILSAFAVFRTNE